ncbi:MAG: mercuric reductase, partial [Alphaproteobacteria bacterium]|nr:mercuric reductase [Alphaproteobacteria bacterium]
HLMGGDCLNFGCVPSKALLKAAHKAHDSGALPDFARIMKDMRQKRAALASHDSARRFRDLGVDVFLGEGRFSTPTSIEVAGKILNFHRAVIATGARAALPPVPGLSDLAPLTNETLFSLETLPKRLIIIGAGPIGCEMAQAFRRFGAKVTLIEMADRLLPMEDPDASAVVQSQFGKEGIDLILKAEIIQAQGRDGDKIIMVRDHGQERTLEADEILVAAGRVPNIDGLNLDAATVGYHRRGVTVNDRLQTTNPRIYAAGDICSAYQFTHSADAMAKIVLQNALFFGRKKVSDLVMPWSVYTAPEVAHVGMTAKEAAGQGDNIITLSARMSQIDRAVLDEATDGFARVHIARNSGRIVGATMVSPHAGESIAEMGLAITSGLKMAAIGATIHPYPTQAEIWKMLANDYRRTGFTPRIAKIFRIFLRLFARK